MVTYQHAEAFMLMTYRSDDGTEEELIWNSRDGVTPFVITLRSGKQATHVDWHNDRRLPDYQPRPGERIFVDLTEEAARRYARANAERFWDDEAYPARDHYPSIPEFAELLAADYLRHPGQPDLIEVTT